jgi:hypothetical protein
VKHQKNESIFKVLACSVHIFDGAYAKLKKIIHIMLLFIENNLTIVFALQPKGFVVRL